MSGTYLRTFFEEKGLDEQVYQSKQKAEQLTGSALLTSLTLYSMPQTTSKPKLLTSFG